MPKASKIQNEWNALFQGLKLPPGCNGIATFAIAMGIAPTYLQEVDLNNWLTSRIERGRGYDYLVQRIWHFRRATKNAGVADKFPNLRPHGPPKKWDIPLEEMPDTDLYVAITTALFDVIGSTRIAERKYEQQGAPVYMYCFVHESKRLIPGTHHIFGAAHASEIVYKFDNVPAPDLGTAGEKFHGGGIFGGGGPSSVEAAHNMSELWTTFARTGRPAAKGQPAWDPYTTDKRATMLINAQCKVVDDPWKLERQVWDEVDPG